MSAEFYNGEKHSKKEISMNSDFALALKYLSFALYKREFNVVSAEYLAGKKYHFTINLIDLPSMPILKGLENCEDEEEMKQDNEKLEIYTNLMDAVRIVGQFSLPDSIDDPNVLMEQLKNNPDDVKEFLSCVDEFTIYDNKNKITFTSNLLKADSSDDAEELTESDTDSDPTQYN